MPGERLFHTLVLTEIALGVLTWVALVFVTAPVRASRPPGLGPESPRPIGLDRHGEPRGLLLRLGLQPGARIVASSCRWSCSGRGSCTTSTARSCSRFACASAARRCRSAIPMLALAFNFLNAWVNAYWISHLGAYTPDWIRDPRFLGGAALFLVGWLINLHSDSLLFRLRRRGETGYRIPTAGCTTGWPAPTIWARSSSGAASRS